MLGWVRNLFGMVVEGRSSQWPKVRAEHLKREPECQWCGTTEDLDVHHIVPYAKVPAMECDATNLLTMCRHDHLVVGHLGSWESWNVNVRNDCRIFQMKRHNRP